MRVQPQVAEFAEVHSYDRAGLAWSDPVRGPVTATKCAAELHDLIASTRIQTPCVLVGHSFGTFVVQAYASAHPENVAGIVLVDPIYPAEFLEASRQQRWRLKGGVYFSRLGTLVAHTGVVRLCLSLLTSGSTAVPKGVSKLFGSEATKVLTRLVGEVQKLPPEAWPAVASHWSQSKCFTSMGRHLSGLPRSAAEIARCTTSPDIPVVVITAASQPPANREAHARIAASSRQGRQIFASASGHWVHLDQPELVVEAIRAVLSEIPSEGSGSACRRRPSRESIARKN
jgi:pimeloyl-ACP methyl ester carboxylesterase